MIKLPPFLVVSALFQDTKKPVLAEEVELNRTNGNLLQTDL
jgi:hypothetical protein